MNIATKLAEEFQLTQTHADNIIALTDEGNTVPFIARYRKEMTGGIDDQKLRDFCVRLEYLRNLEKRKEEVRKTITEQEKMTDELSVAIDEATTMTEIEDIYRPFKPKRRTRATVAVAAGLQPLADRMLLQEDVEGDIMAIAAEFVSEENGISSPEKALAGARDIVAEAVSDDAAGRKELRELINKTGEISSVPNKECEAGTYDMYRDYKEPVAKIPSHRVLALNRGEQEEFLTVKLTVDADAAIGLYRARFVKSDNIWRASVDEAIVDGYARLIFPSVEREVRGDLFAAAAEQAIKMFELNLKPLLLSPPIKNKVVMGLDPGYRTGCKVAVVDGTGKVLDHTIVYPTHGEARAQKSKHELIALIRKHGVTAIAIGNGTASKETEIFAAEIIKECESTELGYMVVSEAGASVYSASKLAADEFPDFDVTTRSAVSIARRMQDPLAELIKIDPKSIGVGQYQHDMPQARLDEALNGVVEDCVNSVGVDINTASAPLLSKIAGLNAGTAKSIVEYREKNGKFTNREQILAVPKIGQKAYAQAAGFLRIPGGENPLDNTAVHPESYGTVEKLLDMYRMEKSGLSASNLPVIAKNVRNDGFVNISRACEVGLPTLRDIVSELTQPGRDIRDDLPKAELRADIMSLKDLHEGMVLRGTVRNVIDFGVFVDIGVHQDGLVHISHLCDRYIKHPSEVVKVGDIVRVKVLGVEEKKNRISLTMKHVPQKDE